MSRKAKSWTRSCAFLILGMIPMSAQAHMRNYLDTYGYYTLEKGRSELELYNDLHNPDDGDNYWENQTEVEYGVTDHYTMGLYGVFREGEGFTAFKIENRYRLAEPGELPVDTAFYLEFKDANDHKDNDEIESKIILSKDYGSWNFTANGILAYEREIEASGEEEWEQETGLTLATCYNTGRHITPGIELLISEDKSRITPGVYIDLAKNVRLNLGVGFGLESKADDAILKSILEFEF